MEEGDLCFPFAADELDIVDEENVRHAVFFLEGGGGAVAERADKLAREFLALRIDDDAVRLIVQNLRVDGFEQMGFSEPGVAVNEEGIVGVGGVGSNGEGRRVRKFIGSAHDEGIEGIFVFCLVVALFEIFGESRLLGGNDGLLILRYDVDLYGEPDDLFKGGKELAEIILLDGGALKADAHGKSGHAVFHFDGLHGAEPGVVSHGIDRAVFDAVIAYGFPDLAE